MGVGVSFNSRPAGPVLRSGKWANIIRKFMALSDIEVTFSFPDSKQAHVAYIAIRQYAKRYNIPITVRKQINYIENPPAHVVYVIKNQVRRR